MYIAFLNEHSLEDPIMKCFTSLEEASTWLQEEAQELLSMGCRKEWMSGFVFSFDRMNNRAEGEVVSELS